MTKTCLKCNHQAPGEPLSCPSCGAVYSKIEALAACGQLIRSVRPVTDKEREQARAQQREREQHQVRTTDDLLARARHTGNWSGVGADVVLREAGQVIMTSTEAVPHRLVAEVRGVIAAESAFAFGAVFEAVAGLVRNVVGSGSSEQTIGLLQNGRAAALNTLRYRALDQGANAVVAIRIDYEEFSGANQRGIMVVIATGTAVRLKDLTES